MIGRTFGHYRVTDEVAAGGMGVVYRAHDEHLDRDVALKVLPDGVLGAEDRSRFRREARLLSRLSHPHVGVVHDFDTEEGIDYLVMEFIPGETLEKRLAQGPLAEAEVIRLGVQIAAALEAAHELGIVHRDLKPSNVMVTSRGQVKVLDFGLARHIDSPSEAASVRLTGTQTVVGTLPYMAPEQLLGGVIDERIDLFALGGVLYQMATGMPPFREALATALVNEILNREPPPPRSINPQISLALESVILKCLAKDPDRRFANARAVADALEAAARGEATDGQRRRIGSLAVLPLENLTGDPEQEYFTNGMTEALVDELARIRGLRVASRTSAMRFRDAARPLPDIARELGVDGIIEGSVMRVGNQVRITARLIEAATDRPLLSRRFERELSDVLALQSEVAASVAEAIQGELSSDDRARLAVARHVDPRAYELYLKGRWAWNRRTEPELRRAIEHFERAIERDPTYAQAFAGLGDAYNILSDNNWIPPEVGFARARAAARRALDLDPHLAEAHTSLAYSILFQDWDWVEAEKVFRRAIELDPDYPTARQWYGNLLTSLGRFDEGIASNRRSIELDPLSTILYTALGEDLYYARRYDESITTYRTALSIDPEFSFSWIDVARSLERTERFEEAEAAYRRAAELTGKDIMFSSGLACTFAISGRHDEARAIRDRLIERARTSHVPSYSIASIECGLGDADRAIEWLERSLKAHDRALIWARVNPRFDVLRGDARFDDLLRRIGFPT